MSIFRKRYSPKLLFYSVGALAITTCTIPFIVSCSAETDISKILENIVSEINSKKIFIELATEKSELSSQELFDSQEDLIKVSKTYESELKKNNIITTIKVELPLFSVSEDPMIHIKLKHDVGPDFKTRTIKKKTSELKLVNSNQKEIKITKWSNFDSFNKAFEKLINNHLYMFNEYFKDKELQLINTKENKFLSAEKLNENVFNNMQANISAEIAKNTEVIEVNKIKITFQMGTPTISFTPVVPFSFKTIIGGAK